MQLPALARFLPAGQRFRLRLAWAYLLVGPFLLNWGLCLYLASQKDRLAPAEAAASFWAQMTHASLFLATMAGIGLVLPALHALLAKKYLRQKAARQLWQQIAPQLQETLPEQLCKTLEQLPAEQQNPKNRPHFLAGLQDVVAHQAFSRPGGQALLKALVQHPPVSKGLQRLLARENTNQALANALAQHLMAKGQALLQPPKKLLAGLWALNLIALGAALYSFLN